MSSESNEKRFRIAFSFAGEKRDFVATTARILAKQFGEEQILYDKYHEAEFARFNLGIYLPKLYGEQSELIVPVLCANYDQKLWTGWEWVHIYGLLTKDDGHRVMPSRFDYANADGLSSAAGFIELDDKTPQQFATLILQRLALNEGKPKDHYIKDGALDITQTFPINNLNDDINQIGPTGHSNELHKNLALKLLEKSVPFLIALKSLLKRESASEIIDYFCSCPTDNVLQLFKVSRKALNQVDFSSLQQSDKDAVLEAVTALYMLASMRLVDATISKQSGHVLYVPRNEHIICAIIATALFGGCLKLLPDYQTQLPQPEFSYEVYASNNGDYHTQSFERAMYVSIYQNNRKVDLTALDSQSLNKQEIADLESRLYTIREIKDSNLCLVISSGISADRAASVSDKFQIPTLFHSNEVENALLGMTHQQLVSHIKEFWLQLNSIRNGSQQSDHSTLGEQPMHGDQITINANQVNFSQSKGKNSIAQSGSDQSAMISQPNGMQWTELTNLLNSQMLKVIDDYPSEKSRNKLQSHLQTAQTELAKPKPDKNLIKKSLESVKDVGDAIEGGEKIVELCIKALPLLALLPAVF